MRFSLQVSLPCFIIYGFMQDLGKATGFIHFAFMLFCSDENISLKTHCSIASQISSAAVEIFAADIVFTHSKQIIMSQWHFMVYLYT